MTKPSFSSSYLKSLLIKVLWLLEHIRFVCLSFCNFTSISLPHDGYKSDSFECSLNAIVCLVVISWQQCLCLNDVFNLRFCFRNVRLWFVEPCLWYMCNCVENIAACPPCESVHIICFIRGCRGEESDTGSCQTLWVKKCSVQEKGRCVERGLTCYLSKLYLGLEFLLVSYPYKSSKCVSHLLQLYTI